MSQRTVQRQRAAPVRMVPVVVRRSGRLMVMLRLMMGLLRLLVVVVRVVGARVAVRATEQGRARSLPVEPALVVLRFVRSVSVRFDPQHEQNDENDGNQGTSDNADNHRRTLLGLGVDAAALVLGEARWRVRLRVRLVRLLRFGVRRFGHLYWWWAPTVRRLVHSGTVLFPVVLVVRWQVHVHYLLLGRGRCLRVGRFADMITVPIAVADGRFGRDVLLCRGRAVRAEPNRCAGGGGYHPPAGRCARRRTGPGRSHRNRCAVAVDGATVVATGAATTTTAAAAATVTACSATAHTARRVQVAGGV